MKTIRTVFTAIIALLFSSLFTFPVHASVSTLGWVSSHSIATSAYGMDLDNSGNVYIAHNSSSSIRKYDSSGTFISSFGSYGTGNSNFKYPTSVAVDSSGNIYVADTNNNQIKKFNSSYVWQWTKGTTTSSTLPGYFNRPHTIAVGPDNNIYVSDGSNYRVQVFDTDGNLIRVIGSRGSENGQFQGPTGITFDVMGNIYVADNMLDNIQVFEPDGDFITKFGESGSGPGQMGGAFALTFDNVGNLNVVDTNHKIVRFASDFSPLTPYGENGSGSGQFSTPRGIALDGSGNLIVVDTGNSRFQKLSYSSTDYQVSGVNSTLEITDGLNGLNIETGTYNGVNGATALIRIKDDSGPTLSDASVDMTSDRAWASIVGDSDRALGKSYIHNLIGSAGVGATHSLYVPIPPGRTSQSVYICPNATDLASVNDGCLGGVERIAGSYVEAFGNITVSLVNDLGDSITYWKIEGMTGSGGLAYNLLEYSGNGSGTILDPYEITTCEQLQEINSELGAVYELTTNIDCTATSGWNAGAGFLPLGDVSNPFSGDLYGNDFTIDGLYIDKATDYSGLFGYMQNGGIFDLTLTNLNYEIGEYAGGLVGYMEASEVDNVHVSGNIGFTLLETEYVSNTGGIIGHANLASLISNSTADVDLDFSPGYGSYDWNELDWTGAFIGVAQNNTEIENCSSSGDIYGHYATYNVGGFIGWLLKGATIRNSHATGNVYIGLDLIPEDGDGDSYDNGGFAGAVGWDGYWLWGRNDAYIYNSYSTGNVYVLGEWNFDIGGFIGTLYNNSVVEDSYSEGEVHAGINNNDVGGFIGSSRQDYGDGTDMARVSRCYSTGDVYADYDTYDIGGFAGTTGWRNITIEDSYSLGNVYGGSIANEYEYLGNIGGFVGSAGGGSIIRRSFNLGSVETLGESWDVGGFAGYIGGDILIEESASLGVSVDGYGDVGGFAGGLSNTNTAYLPTISNSYTRTNVISKYLDIDDPMGTGADAAGFIGWLRDNTYSLIENSYAAGAVDMITNPIDNVNTTLSADAPWDATTITVADATNIVPDGYLMIGNPGPAPFTTTLTAEVLSGGVSLEVVDPSGLAAYNTIYIDYGVEGKQDYAQIQTIVGNTLNLFNPIDYDHEIGAEVRKIESDPREVVLVREVNGNDITITREMAYSYNDDWYTGDPVVHFDFPSISGASGGFVGYFTSAPITNSYWDMDLSGYTTSYGGTGLTTAQMKSSVNYSGWDFVNTWGIDSNINDGYPFLSFDDPTFSSLGLSDGSLNPSFNRFTTYYTVDIPGSSINFTPNLNQSLYQSLTLNGVPINDGEATSELPLNAGMNSFDFDILSYSFRPLNIQVDVNSGGAGPTNTPTPTPTPTPSNTPIPTPSSGPLPTSSTVPTTTPTTQPAGVSSSPTPTPCLYDLNGECINTLEISDVTTTINGNDATICWRTNIPATANIEYFKPGSMVEETISQSEQTYFCQSLNDLEYDEDYNFTIKASYEEVKASYEGELKTGLPSPAPVYSCAIYANANNAKIEGNVVILEFTTDNADSCSMNWGIEQSDLNKRADLNRSGSNFTSYLELDDPLPSSIYYRIICGSGSNQCTKSDRIILQNDVTAPGINFMNLNIEIGPMEFLALTGLVFTITPISIAFPQFWLYGIAFIFPKKKQRPWGIVYDLKSLNPIAFAVIRLFDKNGVLLKQSVSDLQGRFSFLVDPGTYQLSVEHSEYNKLNKDITILREDSKIAENIGLISLEGNKPIIASLRNSMGSFFLKTYWLLGLFGMLFSLVALITNFEFINLAIFIIYIIQLIIMLALRPKRDFGFVYNASTGERIKGAFIQVQDVAQGRQVDVQMSDDKGRFGFNLDQGDYILIVSLEGKVAVQSNLTKIELKDGSIGFKYETSMKNVEIALM